MTKLPLVAGFGAYCVHLALPEVAIYTDGACSGNGRRDPRGGRSGSRFYVIS